MNLPPFELADEVRATLMRGGPVVALETTLVAHGLPWPENLETACEAEAAVRLAGAVPATIAVLGGRVRVGLSHAELEQIARSGDFVKAGRRDLGAVLAWGRDAATTVSAALWVARTCGLGVLATGGLGGVHRGAATTFDISTDLDELARADGALVVCSGVKSILDVPATLDALETRGVA
ncbi:MAG: pseudouridine-5'-phosphate glycosidase, partial [Isosphaeraceae bacterium]|nr:pseudouridine-5'-phosphate glycosidase [Isosphaeraceae bacterium]